MTFKYGYEQQDLFVEQGTDRVPADEQFHIVYRGEVIETHRTSKRALARLQQIRFAVLSGAAVAPNPKTRALQEEITRSFLHESSREKRANRTRKGGKGR